MIKRYFWVVLVVAIVVFVYFFAPDPENFKFWVATCGMGMWFYGLANAPNRLRADDEPEVLAVMRQVRLCLWVSGFGAGLIIAILFDKWLFRCECIYFPFWNWGR